VDNAMRENWDRLYVKAKDMFAEGKTYDVVISEISEYEPDIEIVTIGMNQPNEMLTSLMTK
jgi:hypothetical protein